MKAQGVPTELTSLNGLSTAVMGAALDSLGVGIIMTGPDLESPGPTITFVNAAFEELTGYSADELIGRSPRLLQGPQTSRDNLARLKLDLQQKGRFNGQDVNYRKNGLTYEFEWIISPVMQDETLMQWVAIQRDVTQDNRKLQTLSAELQHRTRNLLAVVRSVAEKTLSRSVDMGVFSARLQALSRVQTALSAVSNERISVESLIAGEFRAQDLLSDRVIFRGPALSLPRTIVETLALALHELVSNARLSLATPDGSVSVVWTTADRDGQPVLVLRWREQGASTEPDAPLRAGYGRELIDRALPFSLRAVTHLEFGPDSLICQIELPL